MPNFWDLPKDVRDIIYRHHLVFDKPVTIEMHREAIGCIDNPYHQDKSMPAIFRLSKKAEREATPFYYGMNVFDIGQMQLWQFKNVTWPRHWNQVQTVHCIWARDGGLGHFGRVRETFVSLSKMKKLEELDIQIDESKMAEYVYPTREIRQRPRIKSVTDQQNLAILRYPGVTGLLTLSRIKRVHFTKTVDANGVESGGLTPGGAIETHILPRLKSKPKAKRQSKGSFFPFLELPAELRNNVYHLLLRVTGPIHPSKEPPTSAPKDPEFLKPTESADTESALAMLSVCKQMNEEAVGVFYGCNAFVFHYPVQLSAFLVTIGDHRKKMIRDITVYYHNIKLGGVELIDLSFPLLTQLPSLRKLRVLMIARLGDTSLRRGWLKHEWRSSWRSNPKIVNTDGANPALIPGMKTLFQLRSLTDIKVRDLELEKTVEALEKTKKFPDFPAGGVDAAVLRLSKAYEHFNAALADAQLGVVNKRLFEDNEWQTWDVFPRMDAEGVKTLPVSED